MDMATGAVFLGLLGLFFVLSLYLLLAQPLWAFLDCALSRAHSQVTRVIWLLMMVFLGVVGWLFVVTFWLGHAVTILYGTWGTPSRILKRATLIPLVAWGATGLLLIGVLVARPGLKERIPAPILEGIEAGRVDPETLEEIETVERELQPLEPFRALEIGPGGSVTLGELDERGIDAGTALPVSSDVQQIAVDPVDSRIFALTRHEVGEIDPQTGELRELVVPPEVPAPSWPIGLAFDPGLRLLVFDSRGPLYVHDVETGEWKTLDREGPKLAAMTHAGEPGLFFALLTEVGNDYVGRLATVNRNGAILGHVELSRSIPTHSWMDHQLQLARSGDRLVALVAPRETEGRSRQGSGMHLYSIDPESGDVVKLE